MKSKKKLLFEVKSMNKLENLVKGVAAISLAGTMYGCATVRTRYPVTAALKQLEKAEYCIDPQTLKEVPCEPYPIVRIDFDFKDP